MNLFTNFCMAVIVFGVMVLVIFGCADTFQAPTSYCSVQQTDSGSVVRCTNGTTGTITNGKDGTNGTNGTAGATGATGATGNTGAQGPQGVPGTSVTTVQFCADYTPTYPSSFPEYGLCINNKLYGVYWDVNLGAFLAYLPPGQYRSTNASEACIFTVVQDCEISP